RPTRGPGVPVTMASPAGGGISGRGGSGVNSAVRGAGLVGLAVVLGIVLLQVVDNGPTGNGATPARTSHATTPTTAPAPTSAGAKPARGAAGAAAAAGGATTRGRCARRLRRVDLRHRRRSRRRSRPAGRA